MRREHVDGKNVADIMLYALSTCIWCRRTKQLLESLGVEYDYVFMDKLHGEEKEEALKEVERWNPKCSFPTMVINREKCIVGHREEEVREALGL